jgi:hypothetical protein
VSVLRLYSVAFLFSIWAVFRTAGFHSDLLVGMFLALTAVLVIVAEKERQRLVRLHRGGYRRRKDDD